VKAGRHVKVALLGTINLTAELPGSTGEPSTCLCQLAIGQQSEAQPKRALGTAPRVASLPESLMRASW
jgi:hypothetical protein